MIDELVTALGQVGIVAVIGLFGALLFRRDFHPGWFLAGLALYVLYDGLLTRAFSTIQDVTDELNWNWLGKSMSLTGMLIVASLPRFGFKKVGLTLAHRPGLGTPIIVFCSLIAVFAVLAATDGSGRADTETILFQWTMPSLDEELFYRGVLLVAMNEAYSRRVTVLGAPIGYGGLLTSLLFGLAHGFGYSDGGFELDVVTFAMTGIPSLILLWLRERTGSLLLPMLAHCASNGLFTVI